MVAVSDIAKLVNGTVIGDGSVEVGNIAPSAFAAEGDLTFAIDEENLVRAGKSKASCVLSTFDIKGYPKTILKVDDIKLAMTVLYNAMREIHTPEKGFIHPSSVISRSALLGKDVSAGPNSVIGDHTSVGDNTCIGANCTIGKNVSIGRNCVLYPNVTLYDYTVLRDRVCVHSGTVIGADGFGYLPKDGRIYKVPQMGTVIIEEDVEIGANSCIDRGTFTDTVIGRGSKIDNLVQIAHNNKIGKNVIIAAQTGIAGSSAIGDNTMFGGQVGVSDHVKVGNNVRAGAKTGIHGNLGDNEVVFGYPCRAVDEAKRLYGLLSILLKYEKKIRKFFRNIPD
ncbi:MAG: UDP-3-O-(3-hydroxymyristoyl)glucosamine N-acyltransferase [Candidatus Omnitrophota bacterium]